MNKNMDLENHTHIERRYKDFEKHLLKNGQMPMRSTNAGFWSFTDLSALKVLFEKINLRNYHHFVDLGSGDGRVVALASLYTKAVGIEADTHLHLVAHTIKKDLALHNSDFINDNFNNYSIDKHDVVYVSPDKPFFRGLDQKMQKELKGLLIVHGAHFQPTQLQKLNETWINGEYFGLFSR